MDRKTFLKTAAGAFLITTSTYSLLSCSGSDDSPDPNNPGGGTVNCLANGTIGSISANHGHTITVSKSDVDAGTAKVYAISGSAGHNHNVTVTASNFSTLKTNQNIQITSTSGDNHTHSVTISCA